MDQQEIIRFESLLQHDHRFTIESYRFILETVNYMQRRNSGVVSRDIPNDRHYSGQELSAAVRDYALEQFGYMARVVLARLGIRRTCDIGDIVYNLISINLISKRPKDHREDFDNVFDLGAELDAGFTFRQNNSKENKNNKRTSK